MNELITALQATPPSTWQILSLCALAFALFMSLIPGKWDPTRFINDKVKHVLTFMVLSLLIDLAFPAASVCWWKPAGLMAFGVFIEVCQHMTRYRRFSFGDIIANGVGIGLYLGISLGIPALVASEGGCQPWPECMSVLFNL
ncbi:hypothetical protein [Endozoicomonas sp. GU-1]|uniref:VanZ family protein n=1 Tax=Endozoicomonas sp. GU-1 TaxID=3009078 RepID=UPI0022B33FC8|nr:hypothetical protein [Endozoicomonas sp. GU-1]WBA83228.1 hypothetical protein O2T12_08970 [Endozoicomonas sp. GU-1]WBA86153.1 hypothetical protein O3276_23600 [Endozoicomonas sp. GU-1]